MGMGGDVDLLSQVYAELDELEEDATADELDKLECSETIMLL
jgi:hypothetical protein